MMTTSTRRSLESADLIIDPDLKGLTSTSWRLSDELADRGYKAAAALDGKLQAYAVSPEAHAAFQAARQAKRRREAAVPTEITFEAIGSPISPRVEAEIRRALSPTLNTPVKPDDAARHGFSRSPGRPLRVPDLRGHGSSQADVAADRRA